VRVEAISWAPNLAPVPDGVANHARPGRHAPVLLRRWLAPVPVHLRYRYNAVTECKVTNLSGGRESRLTPIICACQCVRTMRLRRADRPDLCPLARSIGSGASYSFGGPEARCSQPFRYALFDASSRVASSSVMRLPGPGSFHCADEA
jgi:hypothetical protein